MNKGLSALLMSVLLSGCVAMAPGSNTPTDEDAELVKGPPIENIVTDFDQALMCLKGKVPSRLAFGVGAIADTTGKEQYADAGTGKMVSQGAGDMVQSALFRAGLTVVNRRDPNIPLAENNWGIRNIRTQIPTDVFISGSITSLDFIPGGAAQLVVAGVGPKYRQNRILVGLDLAMTDANTGRLVANIPLQKQLYAKEIGFETSRFFDDTLLEADLGGMEREALHFTLRQMLSYAVFELLAQTLGESTVKPCRDLIKSIDATSSGLSAAGMGPGLGSLLASADAAAAERQAPQTAGQPPAPQPGAPQAGAPQAAAPQGNPAPAAGPQSPPEARKLAAVATAAAAHAIAAADNAAKAETAEEADKAATESETYMLQAVQALKLAAAKGLTGPEGDAAATLVEQAMQVAEQARKIADAKKAAATSGGVAAPGGTTAPANVPNLNSKEMGGVGAPSP